MTSTTDPVQEESALKLRARRNLTWLMLFSIVMFFAGLSSAYIVSRSSADYWVTFRLPSAFWYSTAIIVVSSLTAQLALWAARKGQGRNTTLWLAATLILGVVFSIFQFDGWKEMSARRMNLVSDKITMTEGVYGTDFTIAHKGIPLERVEGMYYAPDDPAHTAPLNADMADHWNASSGYFHVFTFGHWLHVVGGLLALLVLTVKSALGRYTAQAHTGVWQGVVYWHFLAGVWIYLLLFIAAVH